MKSKWILLGLFLFILITQFKNFLSFVSTEIGVYFGFGELDKNLNGIVEKQEWPKGSFSLVDFDRDGQITKYEFREFIKEFSNEFSWENNPNEKYDLPEQLIKGSFFSDSMRKDVGYFIYIPESYTEQPDSKFRTVYYLHGGRPGNEAREVFISNFVHKFIGSSSNPALYVFVNGGELSHYNSEDLNSYGENIFINELIPHIDKTYRTIPESFARGLEGFSQGGRGATRYMFKYPELFGTVSAGGGSYAIEKLIQESSGYENDPRDNSEDIFFVGEGNDTWSLAKKHKDSGKKTPKLLLWSGDRDMNFESIKNYSNYLKDLEIDYSSLIAKGVDHNSFAFYEVMGAELFRFHEEGYLNAK